MPLIYIAVILLGQILHSNPTVTWVKLQQWTELFIQQFYKCFHEVYIYHSN